MELADHIVNKKREIPSQHREINSQQSQVTPSKVMETVKSLQA